MFSKSRWAAVVAGVVTTILALTGQSASASVYQTYGFERGLGGWTMGYEGEGAYEMYRSTEESYRGYYSLECYLDGQNGTGTAWMMRSYPAPMDTLMSLNMTFQLWSESASDVNNWEVVAYIGTTPPRSRADFEVIGYTDMVAGWQRYSFDRLQLTGQEPSSVWVAFGISSGWEYARAYYMDQVTVSLVP